MLSSVCKNCGSSKDPSEYALPYCRACDTHGNEVAQHAAASDPNLSPSDLLYIKRQAISQRALRPSSSYIDPRQFAGRSGLIPTPPQSDRGTPPA